jgi:hypothetical protein
MNLLKFRAEKGSKSMDVSGTEFTLASLFVAAINSFNKKGRKELRHGNLQYGKVNGTGAHDS